MLVFDSTNEASFNFVKQWAASGEATDAEIKLCIANKADRLLAGTSLERSAWLDAAADWCTRELYEYIEVSRQYIPPAQYTKNPTRRLIL